MSSRGFKLLIVSRDFKEVTTSCGFKLLIVSRDFKEVTTSCGFKHVISVCYVALDTFYDTFHVFSEAIEVHVQWER